jgi:PEP-CTERM motif
MTHFKTPRIFLSALNVFVAAAALWAISPAYAAPMTQNYVVDFSASTQSFWGPGQSSASFAYNYTLGSTNFGVGFSASASSGTVSANDNGSVSVSYNSTASEGSVPLTIGYSGASNGGSFHTALGASIDVTAYFPVPFVGTVPVTITNPGYALNTGATFTPSPPDAPHGSDSFTPAASAIGPNIGILSGQAGINYNIVQNSTLDINALTGTATATNQTSGHVQTAAFSLGALDTITLDLNEPGIWDVALSDLALSNLFSTNFDLGLQPFIEYTAGINCDPFNPKNNGLGCVADGALDKTIASFEFYHNNPFALDFGTNDTPSTFQINVAAPATPVPEPSTLSVFGFGLLALFAARRRYLRRA